MWWNGWVSGEVSTEHNKLARAEVFWDASGMKRIVATIGFVCISSNLCFAEAPMSYRFQEDVEFLKKHTETILLAKGDAQVAVVPAYQGRIMTSTAAGPSGLSFGWLNRGLIASRQFRPHINVFGGEDRFWIGPEGGQFSVFFAKGVPFDLEHWFTPAPIDTEPFQTVSKSAEKAVFRHAFQLVNYSGTKFDVEVTREVRLVDAAKHLGVRLKPSVKGVAVESVNTLKNAGKAPWKKETGLLSIWILGMLNASPATTVVIPFVKGPESKLGPVVNDAYFGKVPTERLAVKDGVLFFAADGKYRSKIGVSPKRAKPVLGSYDAVNKVLTIVQFTLPKGVTDYVNSMWKLQDDPYNGDAVNSYNDDGKLGAFYELESSSPALALAPGRSATHVHRTIHVQGTESDLDSVAVKWLGVHLEQIRSALK